MMRASLVKMLVVVGSAAFALPASDADAGIVVAFSEASGLAGEAEFTLINPTTLQIRLRNLSTGAPGGFDSADQLLTSVAFNLNGINITGGSVFTGANSSSINFSVLNVGPNADVSGEWGFGNGGTTGFEFHPNFISAMTAGVTPFGGANLDGRTELDGPQGGLVANPMVVSLGGLGAIQDEVVATVTLSAAVSDLSFLDKGVVFEFGSDAAFIIVPAPGALMLLAMAGVIGCGHRRRRAA